MRKEKDNTRPKKKRGRIFLRVLGAILCVILAFVLVTTIVTIIGSSRAL